MISAFSLTMAWHAWLKWPALTLKDRKIFKTILLSRKFDDRLDIFEYGTGYSTYYFARFLKGKKIPFHFHSIDNNRPWHEKIKTLILNSRIDNEVTLHLCSFIPFWEKQGWDWKNPGVCGQFSPQRKEEFDYINRPLSLNQKFDMIVIDGRFRKRCLEVARACLKPRGIIFFHDAQKPRYTIPDGFIKYAALINDGHFFPFERTSYRCWVGSPDDDIVLDLAKEFQ